ncbi:MAG: penicillin-binding protein 2, partial [Chloroflexota bacterium]
GLLGRDQSGLGGVEMDYDRELAGAPGTLVYERDSLGNPIPLGFRSEVQSKPGGNLVLTLDRFVQRTIERELQAAMERHKAAGGTIIVMDPNTGAILGMASRPTFDLRKPNLSDPKSVDLMRNRAITDLYEPGSTFKVLTMAMAINEGLVTPETTYMDGGPVTKYGIPLETWDFRHHGTQTMNQLLITSNNIGAVWVGEKVGVKRFYEYANKFGIGQPTSVGLSGEAAGQLRTPADKDNWWPIDLATNSFGQGLSVTPLQMVTAVGSVINGGTLMRPYLVQRIETPEATRTFQPTPVRRVISEEASRTMRAMMNTIAEQGGTTSYAVPGFRIGVKTGTATIPGEGGYKTDSTIASIVGFAPYERPRAVVLVKLDAPKDSPWGSVVAGPIFSNVVRELMVYWRIAPTASAMVSNRRP